MIALLSAAKPIDGWGALEWMRRQSEALTQEALPTLAQEHAGAAVMQIGVRRPSDFVKVIVPGDPSHVYGVSGEPYLVEIEDGRRVAWMAPDDARTMIRSPLNLAFFELNAELRARLGAKAPQPRGIRGSDLIRAIEDARPVAFSNRGGMIRQSLGMLRRAR